MQHCIKCSAELPEGAAFCPACGKKQAPEVRKHRKRANGSGNISKLSGNRSKPWVARRNDVCIGTYATRAEAQKALERVTDATITEKYNLTFEQIYGEWKPVQERKVSASQMGCYSNAFNLCPELHGQMFRKLRKADFQGVIIRLEQEGKSKSTCEKVRQLFSQLSKWAMGEEIIQVNHAQHIDTVAKQLTTKQVLLEADIKAIQASKLAGRDIVLILLGCGCRPNELFNALLVNCHDDYFIGGSKTEAGRNRIIFVAEPGLEAYQSLRRAAIAAGGAKLIDGFQGNRDQHNFAKREFKEIVAEIGKPGITMHCCRHTFITNAVRSGVDQRVLQQLVGHVDKETTKLYTHLDLDDLRDQAQRINCFAVCNKSVTRSKTEKFTMQKSS